MTTAVTVGAIGLFLSGAAALAGEFNAEVDFVTRASTANLFAIAESRLALERTSEPKVKAFARQMIDAHRTAQAELRIATEKSGARVSTSLSLDDQTRLAALQRQSGTNFDKAYVADQGEIHSNALTLYADYMLLGDNEKLKALAIKMIPIDEAQLRTIQAISGD